MKIGILKADDVRPELAARFGEYPDMITALMQSIDQSIETVCFDVYREQYPADAGSLDGYIITGSKHSVYENLPWINKLSDFVRELVDRKIRLVGICFGHQLVAQALGGHVERASIGWNIGMRRMPLDPIAGELAGNVGDFRILYSHQDQVIEAAPIAQVIAGDSFCPVGMTRIGNHVLTLQGHPEFPREYGKELLKTREHLFTHAEFQAAYDSLDDHTDSDRRLVAHWLVDFLKAPLDRALER